MRRIIPAALVMLALSGCAGRLAPRGSAPNPTDDTTIATRVRVGLLNEPNVHASEITVEVAQGVVTLKGNVHGQQEADAAVARARKVTGVKDVKSELETSR
jgi:osmotically-inducible protein OsmY